MTAPIQDLRDAIALLQQHDNQYLETDHPVDPNAELAGAYRHIGAGGTVKRPTRIGPAMMFNNIKGYPHSRILVGMHASRQRAALLLGYMALLSAVAQTIWSALTKYNPVGRGAVYGFLNPVFGVLLSALLLSEGEQAFTMYGLAALVLVCAGILLVNRSGRK